MPNFVDTEVEKHTRCMASVDVLLKAITGLAHDDEMPDQDWWNLVVDSNYDAFDVVEAAFNQMEYDGDLDDEECESFMDQLYELRKVH